LANEAQLFGVANLEEAIQLRARLPHSIIVLGPGLPEERSTIAERGFVPTVSTFEEAQEFSRLVPDKVIAIAFKIDTGMGRMGVPRRDFRHRARRHRALRDFAPAGVSKTSQTGDDLENENCARAGYAQGKFHQLRPDVHHSAKNADCDVVGWLRRRVSATSFQSGCCGFGSRSTMPATWSRDDGFDDD